MDSPLPSDVCCKKQMAVAGNLTTFKPLSHYFAIMVTYLLILIKHLKLLLPFKALVSRGKMHKKQADCTRDHSVSRGLYDPHSAPLTYLFRQQGLQREIRNISTYMENLACF